MFSFATATRATRTRPPAATLAAVTIGVLIGTITSAGALYFGLKAGGGWIVSAALASPRRPRPDCCTAVIYSTQPSTDCG